MWCLMSQFQAIMPNWCLMDGSKNSLHLPGAKGGAVPFLALCFPSSCLCRVMDETGCHVLLGASFCMGSLTQCWPFLGARHFGEAMGYLHEGLHLASPACV